MRASGRLRSVKSALRHRDGHRTLAAQCSAGPFFELKQSGESFRTIIVLCDSLSPLLAKCQYNLIAVELLFNLVWVALSSSLIAVWFVAPRPPRRDFVREIGWKKEALALTLLILILLPIVSLTDDVQALNRDQQAWVAPPEVKRALHCGGCADGMEPAVPGPSLWIHAVSTVIVPLCEVPREQLFPPEFAPPQLASTKPIESRPPPSSQG